MLCIPLWQYSLWILFPQSLISLVCLQSSCRIFTSWEDKKRKYNILITRNADAIRLDTFTEYMQAPCGRLLVKIVLKDLGKDECYNQLTKMMPSFGQQIQNNLHPHSTIIYVNPKYTYQKETPIENPTSENAN